MALSKKKLFALSAPILSGAFVLGSASPALADGPTESTSLTSTFVKTGGAQVSCTLTLSLITHYQNDARRGFASFDITNNADCRNATLLQSVSWTTDNGGSGSTSEVFTSQLPTHFEDAYSPLHPTVATAQFTESAQVVFNNCMSNCEMDLTLTADGKA